MNNLSSEARETIDREEELNKILKRKYEGMVKKMEAGEPGKKFIALTKENFDG